MTNKFCKSVNIVEVSDRSVESNCVIEVCLLNSLNYSIQNKFIAKCFESE